MLYSYRTHPWSNLVVSRVPTLSYIQYPLSLCLWSMSPCHEDVAASTSRRHAGLSIARRLAVARPKLSGRRSSSTVLSQVCLGLPVLRRQSLGGSRVQARRAREWSWPVSARHRWPKNDKSRWRIVSDRSGCPMTEPHHWKQNPSKRSRDAWYPLSPRPTSPMFISPKKNTPILWVLKYCTYVVAEAAADTLSLNDVRWRTYN